LGCIAKPHVPPPEKKNKKRKRIKIINRSSQTCDCHINTPIGSTRMKGEKTIKKPFEEIMGYSL
jgi:hypothetical protein